MMYRVYDKKKKRWIKDDVFLTPEGELFQSSKSVFGNRLTFVSEDRYVYQKSIGLYDKDNIEIFVGDYLEARVAEDRVITGLVTFAAELSSYIILCFDSEEFFTLGESVCEYVKVIGNVFNEPKK